MFLTYIYRELRRRHRQAILTSLGLALGICLVIVVSAAAGGVRNAQTQVLHSLYGVGTDITVSQNAATGSGGPVQFGMNPGAADKQGQRFSRDRINSTPGLALISDKKVTAIANLDSVSAAVGGLTLSSIHVSGQFAQVTGGTSGPPTSGSATSTAKPSQAPIKIDALSIAGVEVTDQSIGPLSSTTITSGRTFSVSETDAKVVVVDSGYAKQDSLAVGDKLKIGGVKFKVIGVSKSASADANVFMPLKRAQTLADEKGKVNQVYVKATSATLITQVKKAIKAAIPGATVTTAQDLANQVSGSLGSASKLANQLGKWLAIAALVAAIAVASLLMLSAVGRRVREFGTLKALGWRSRRIVSQVLGEALAMGVAGGIAGIGLGYAGAQLISQLSPSLQATVASAGFPTGGSTTSAGAPGGAGPGSAMRSLTHTVTVSLHAVVSPALLAVAIALAIGGALIAGALGGWRAARLSPADALRRVD